MKGKLKFKFLARDDGQEELPVIIDYFAGEFINIVKPIG